MSGFKSSCLLTHLGLLDSAPITSFQDMIALDPKHSMLSSITRSSLAVFELSQFRCGSTIIPVLWKAWDVRLRTKLWLSRHDQFAHFSPETD